MAWQHLMSPKKPFITIIIIIVINNNCHELNRIEKQNRTEQKQIKYHSGMDISGWSPQCNRKTPLSPSLSYVINMNHVIFIIYRLKTLFLIILVGAEENLWGRIWNTEKNAMLLRLLGSIKGSHRLFTVTGNGATSEATSKLQPNCAVQCSSAAVAAQLGNQPAFRFCIPSKLRKGGCH